MSSHIKIINNIIFIVFGCCLSALGQVDSLLTDDLDEVVIQATRLPTPLQSAVYSISSLDVRDKYKGSNLIAINEYLNHVPGLFALNADNQAQDLRVSIRGFGARSAFGIRGIKLIVDGIPQTTPDGQGQLDHLSVALMDKIEVIRGPVASLYGNAAGGVIKISYPDTFDKSFLDGNSSVGSFGQKQYFATVGIAKERDRFLFHAYNNVLDGYRSHSESNNTNLYTRWVRDFSDQTSLRLHADLFYSPKAQDPGGIDLAAVEQSRRSARDRNISFDAGEKILQTNASIQLNHEFSMNNSLQASAFYSRRRFDGLLPFGFGGAIDLNREYGGHQLQFNTKQEWMGSKHQLQIGYEIAQQRDNRRRFVNEEGLRGDKTLDQQERFDNYRIYFVDQIDLSERLIFSIGAGYDINRISIADEFLSNGDQSSNQTLSRLNPSLGFNYSINAVHSVFGNLSTSFETPVLSELSNNPNGSGGFNTDLKPQSARNLELGIRGTINKQLEYSWALYSISTDDEILPFELEDFPERDFFRNAGKTKRTGTELSLFYDTKKDVNIEASYSYGNFRFDEYSLNGRDLTENKLPGIPDQMLNLSLRYNPESGHYATLNLRHIGLLYADNANEVQVDPYTTLNLRFGTVYEKENLKAEPFLGVNNILSTEYYDNVRLNAFGGRYYEPAADWHFYVGTRFRIN